MGKFVITKNEKDEFQFNFIDNDENVILSSGNYIRKSMCINGIISVKRNSQDKSKFILKRSAENETFFILKSFNGRVLGKSQTFDDKFLRDKAIESFRNAVPNAVIEDESKK
jgi:uncharacterized protein